jgi:hypothetical protein
MSRSKCFSQVRMSHVLRFTSSCEACNVIMLSACVSVWVCPSDYVIPPAFFCLCVCVPPNSLVFYAPSVIPKESKRIVLPSISSFNVRCYDWTEGTSVGL